MSRILCKKQREGIIILRPVRSGHAFTPVLGDYDGDGKTDIAINHTPNGGCWIMRSSDGGTYGNGLGGDLSDKPVTTTLS